jgi:hypothetical protein
MKQPTFGRSPSSCDRVIPSASGCLRQAGASSSSSTWISASRAHRRVDGELINTADMSFGSKTPVVLLTVSSYGSSLSGAHSYVLAERRWTAIAFLAQHLLIRKGLEGNIGMGRTGRHTRLSKELVSSCPSIWCFRILHSWAD